jgi:large subunit ribosomal protein L9
MKVILMSDVKSLGKAGTVLEVAEGYARNFLLPRGLAAEASAGSLAALDQQRKAKARQDAEALAEARALAASLETAEVSVAAKSGGNGKLFGAVTNADIAAAIERTLGVAVDRHKIVLPENIKSLGSYPIEVRLGKSVVAKTTVKVVASAT